MLRITEYAKKNYRKCFREPDGHNPSYRFIVPGSTYSDCLWDWDCRLGPIRGISNYMVFDGLRNCGYVEEARQLAEKTITLFEKDIEACGELHEYYHPDTGEGVNNPGFQNWKLLSLNMIDWLNELSV